MLWSRHTSLWRPLAPLSGRRCATTDWNATISMAVECTARCDATIKREAACRELRRSYRLEIAAWQRRGQMLGRITIVEQSAADEVTSTADWAQANRCSWREADRGPAARLTLSPAFHCRMHASGAQRATHGTAWRRGGATISSPGQAQRGAASLSLGRSAESWSLGCRWQPKDPAEEGAEHGSEASHGVACSKRVCCERRRSKVARREPDPGPQLL
ncbi:uncharacterized protein BDZ99DRAFT_575889 [Mytilinidion resinicola]|uniref:Uncharacterized protein n=1 Tax=Mytilinidion resinicola TaxID=574789 RepID=A0A6A6Y597_9PEZI|nr:uncharacterized protein BDZ99DRAFT_575889 [Mytilinidion resinicola]KAF2803830.1 hypothetical protein BDZ99DRAFT_575889 [Mytilinidion resinicola]